jgi:hypothetical protein
MYSWSPYDQRCSFIRQVCNALGVKRSLHKQCGCETACLSLPAADRFREENIFLSVLSRAKVYKKHGMARVLCGVDKDGQQHDEPNFAADMRALDEGVWIEIPDDENGGMRRVRLRAWIMLVSADYPAAQSVLPFMESVSAHVYCRGCDVNQSTTAADRPFSFLKRSAPGQCAGGKRGCPASWKERDWPQLSKKLTELKAVSATQRGKEFSQLGLNKIVFAFDDKYIPHVHPIKVAPQETLHLFPDGLLRHEGAWLFYILIKLGLSIAQANAAIRSYKDWPPDVKIPPLQESLKEGVAGGRPKSERVLRMAGSQVMHFALHR